MPTILIGGYYGAGNIGDEAILEAMLNELRTQKPDGMDLSFIVLSWDPEKTSTEHDVRAILWNDIHALLDAVLKTDCIIVGGGGIFQDYWGFDPITYLRKTSRDISAFGSLPLLAKLLDIPCMIYAVGVGPFKSDVARDHTRLAFERCQVATVRDQESLEFLKQTGFDFNDPALPSVEIYPDPVFALATTTDDSEQVNHFLQQRNIDEGTPLLGISLRHWDIDKSPEEWLTPLASDLKAFLGSHPQVHGLLLPFQVLEATPFTNDVPVLKQLAEQLDLPGRLHLIDQSFAPRFAQALIARCEVIVGMRLHAVIAAINESKPVVALSYAPKVQSVMEYAGLNAFCNPDLTLSPGGLTGQLQTAWDQREALSREIKSAHHTLRDKAKGHARLALNLLINSKPGDHDFPQHFSLEQIRRLYEADQAYEHMRETLQTQIWELQEVETKLTAQSVNLNHQLAAVKAQREELLKENTLLKAILNEIQSTRVWKMGQRWYGLRDNTILKYPYYFAVITKREGLLTAIQMAKEGQLIPVKTEPVQTIAALDTVRSIVATINSRSYKGVFVLTSAFEFDELYNQRVINLSKYLAREGWGVVYAAWVWHDASEAPPGEVKENIFQIPSNIFLEGYEALRHLSAQQKIFTVEFPYPGFLEVALALRSSGFIIHYDIIDEWEEFHQVGQAEWFDQDAEQGLVVNANILSAVSEPLVEKFAHLRKDIHLIPNGFDPTILGDFQNIAQRNFQHDKINLGYFGHLTPSWFDWTFIKEILDLARGRKLDVKIHLIGYGQPDLRKTLGDDLDSIVFHGKIHPENLHTYAHDWDLAILPFKSTELSRAVDPIKIYEYLYFGLPVIVKGIPHLSSLNNVYVVSNAEEFMQTLQSIRDQKITQELPNLIYEHTWEKRFTQLIQILEGELWMSL